MYDGIILSTKIYKIKVETMCIPNFACRFDVKKYQIYKLKHIDFLIHHFIIISSEITLLNQ